MDVEVVSLLSKLEPALGITFALNLAYIGLPRFRYRQLIRDHVRQKMVEMSDIPAQHCETEWYQQIVRLGELNDNSGLEEASAEVRKTSKIRMPDGLWAGLYQWVYEWHVDRVVTIVSAVICAVLLFGGVAHELKIQEWSVAPFTDGWISLWFWFTALMAIIPPLLVFLGSIVVRGATSFVTRTTINLKKTLKQTAQEATLLISPSDAANGVVKANGQRKGRIPTQPD